MLWRKYVGRFILNSGHMACIMILWMDQFRFLNLNICLIIYISCVLIIKCYFIIFVVTCMWIRIFLWNEITLIACVKHFEFNFRGKKGRDECGLRSYASYYVYNFIFMYYSQFLKHKKLMVWGKVNMY